MRSMRFVLVCTFVVLASGCSKDQPSPTGVVSGPGPVPFSIDVAQGGHIQVRTILLGAPVHWSNLPGPDAGYVSSTGMYHAPIHLAAERRVTLQAENSGGTATVQLRVLPGPVTPGDCLAPGQRASGSGIDDYVYAEELPEAIVTVPPVYPDLAREAGVEGLVMVMAHVCVCGQVDEVRVVYSIPMLDEAAKTAVRQWVFKPALTGNEAVAVWVGVPVRFSLH
jgi:TonB family protein